MIWEQSAESTLRMLHNTFIPSVSSRLYVDGNNASDSNEYTTTAWKMASLMAKVIPDIRKKGLSFANTKRPSRSRLRRLGSVPPFGVVTAPRYTSSTTF